MATIAVTAALSGTGATAGQIALATFAANVIDQAFIFPALFGGYNQTAPKLGDISVQGAEEGQPQNQCVGPECVTSGTLFWSSFLRVDDVTEHVGKSGSVTSFRYFRDVAMHLCHNEIQAVDRIKADGKLIYTRQPDVLVESHLLTVELREESQEPIGSGTNRFLKITSQISGPDLLVFQEGRDVVLEGFTPAANNGTFRIVSTGTTNAGFSRIKVRDPDDPEYPFADGTAGDVNNPASLFQNLPRWTPGQADAFNLKRGTDDQAPSGTIENQEGAGSVPAFANQAYELIQNLALTNFNNRVPGFMFLVRERDTCTVAEAITQICIWGGLTESQVDVTGLADREFRGYTMRGLQSTVERLGPILLAYDVSVVDTGTALAFRDRSNPVERSIAASDLGAGPFAGNNLRALQIQDTDDKNTPRRVRVSYTDPDSDYQSGAQGERRRGLAHGEQLVVQLPLTLSGADAKKLARRLLWTAAANRQRAAISLPPSYLGIAPGYVLTFDYEDHSWRILVETVDRGADFTLRIRGLVEVASTMALPETPIEPGGATIGDIAYFPPDAYTRIFDWAPLRNSDVSVPGIYYGSAATGQTAGWIGGELRYKRLDNQGEPVEGPFITIAQISTEVTTGESNGTLGGATPGLIDIANTVEVELAHGTLESVSEEDFLDGVQIAIVGSEVIAYRDAVLTAPHTYELSYLLRGLRDTQGFIDDHEENEAFTLITGSYQFTDPGFQIFNDFVYTAIPAGGQPSEYIPRRLSDEFQGGTARPFTPGNFRGVFDTTGNLDLTWQRRSRWVSEPLGSGTVPLLEDVEGYVLEFRENGNLKFTAGSTASPITTTHPITGLPYYQFTQADQAANNFVSTDTIQCRVQQVGNIFDARQGQTARYRRQAELDIVKP